MKSIIMISNMACLLIIIVNPTLMFLVIGNTVTALPQNDIVSQDVDDQANDIDQYDGRSNDQWWKNYELVEDHVDDLDDQLEMLYMYSGNPLGLAATAAIRHAAATTTMTTPRPSSTRNTVNEPVRQRFMPNHVSTAASQSRSVFLSGSTTALPSVSKWPTTPYYPPSQPQSQRSSFPVTASGYNDHYNNQASLVYDEPETSSQKNLVRVLVKRPTVGHKPGIPLKDADSKPLYENHVPKKATYEKQTTAAVNPYSVSHDSDLTHATYPSTQGVPHSTYQSTQGLPHSTYQSTQGLPHSTYQSTQGVPRSTYQSTQRLPHVTEGYYEVSSPHRPAVAAVTAETYRTTDSTGHPYVASTLTTGRQLPRYSRLLNRYSLLDTVNRDLNSASSEHRDDLSVSLAETQSEYSPRQTRNDVHPPSARTFQSALGGGEGSTTVPMTVTKRSRRRRPKTTTVSSFISSISPITSATEPSQKINHNDDLSSTIPSNENLFSRHPTKRFRSSTTSPIADYITTEDFITTSLPHQETKLHPIRPFFINSRPRIANAAPVTNEEVTSVYVATSTPLPPLVARQLDRIGRTGGVSLSTVPLVSTVPTKTTSLTTESGDLSITESFRIKHTTVKPKANDSSSLVEAVNEVSRIKSSPTSKPGRSSLRQRTVSSSTATSQNGPHNTVTSATTIKPVTSQHKDGSQFSKPPRGTSAFRKPFATSTVATTAGLVANSTTLPHTTHRPFGSSRLRFKSTTAGLSTTRPTTTKSSPILENDSEVATAISIKEPERRRFQPRHNSARLQHGSKTLPANVTTSSPQTTTFRTVSVISTAASIVPDTPAEPVIGAKNSFTKKFRPRPTSSRFQLHPIVESTTPAPQEQPESSTESVNSDLTTLSFYRPTSRLPLKTRLIPSTQVDAGTTNFPTTSSPVTSTSSPDFLRTTASASEGNATRITDHTFKVPGGKRRRQPIGSKKPLGQSSTSPAVLHDTTQTSSPIKTSFSSTSTTRSITRIGFTKHLATTTPSYSSTNGLLEVSTNSSVPRQKFRRRKLTQRSTVSGADEHRILNATTIAKEDFTSTTTTAPHTVPTSTITTTTSITTTGTLSSTTDITKQTQEVTKKPLFNVKLKVNETDPKEEKGFSFSRLNIALDDTLMLQADESEDSIWFSGAAKNVEADDDIPVSGGSSRLFNIEQSGGDRKQWLAAASDEGFPKADESRQSSSDDTIPPLLGRITEEMEEPVNEDTTTSDVDAEDEVKPKLIQKSRTATFSVSSSTSVRDETSKGTAMQSDSLGNDKEVGDSSKDDEEDDPKFIIIDKTALRGSDVVDEDKTTTESNNQHADADSEFEDKEVSSDSETTEKATTTSTSSTTVESEDQEEKEQETTVTPSKSDRRNNSKVNGSSSRSSSSSRTSNTPRTSSKDDDKIKSTSRSGNRNRTSETSRRQQQSSSTTKSTMIPTTEESSNAPDDAEDKKSPSDSAVSYFGEDDVAPSDHGVLDDLDSGGGEEGAVESSYDPDSRVEESEGGEVSVDGVFEHSDDEHDSAHQTVSAVEDGVSSSSGRWGISPLSDFSGPIRVSSSINVEVLSKAPKLLQQASRHEAKNSRRGTNLDGQPLHVKTRSRQRILHDADSVHDTSNTTKPNLNRTGLATFHNNTEDSLFNSEEEEEEITDTSSVTTTTKRDVGIKDFPYSLPLIKSADDIAELFDVITNSPSEDKIQSFQPPSKAVILKINSTLGNETVVKPKQKESGDKMAEVKTMNFNLFKGPTNCSKAERNLCPKAEDYPREIVEFVVQRHEDQLDRLWNEIQADRTNTRMFPEERERKEDELSVCESSIEALQPGWARDAVTGKWMIIINTPQYPQVIRIESCQRPQRECLFISPYYKSTCVEHNSIHRLVAIPSDNPSGGPVVGVFRFPCGCSCKVEMFNSHKH